MRPLLTVFALALLAWTPVARPYEVNTHQRLSREAVNGSIVPRKITDFGLQDMNQRIVVSDTNTMVKQLVFCEPTSAAINQTVMDLVALGSICEDAAFGTGQPLRFLNHFYDPQHEGQGLSFAGQHIDSLSWALDSQANIASQQYSVRRAKDYLVSSLTLPGMLDRQRYLGLLFRSLGHLMHLVQDVGAPQHTRNDSHGSGSAYEAYVDRQNKFNLLVYAGYPPVAASKIEELWHTSAFSGLADYSSRSFVSTGTNFVGNLANARPNPGFPLPNPAGATPVLRQITDPDLLGPVGPAQHLVGSIYFIPTTIVDEYKKSSETNPMTSTFSLFDEDLQHYAGMDMRFTVNRFTFREAANRLIPRTIGYSAGLLNYFFRGSLKIAPPDEGVFAIVNHSPGDPVPAGCGTPCGFRTLKLKASNTTASENMGAGTLLLVAKYHLNNCYLPDLSGEFGGSAYTGSSCRSAEELITVSDPVAVSQVRNDFSDPALKFEFRSPIPINAVDLRLQIIFRGMLGQENDAVALSSVDVYEPTYLIFSNDNDYINVYNADGSFSRNESYEPVPGRFSVRIDLRFNQSAQSSIATNSQLDPGFYHRLAILTDQEFLPYWMVEQYIGSQPYTREFILAASENQTNADDQVFNFPTYVPLRRTTPTAFAYEADEDGGTIYWMPGYICADGTTRCIPKDKSVGGMVRLYPPSKQPTPLPMNINF